MHVQTVVKYHESTGGPVGRALLYLVRHGEPDHQAGQADPGLSDLGREQAGRLGRRLAGVPFDVIRHSPLRRAAQTDRCELLVTHNFVIGWFVGRALDAPGWRWLSLNQFCCALTILSARPGRPLELITFNDLGHLPPSVRGQAPLGLPS
jgi:broad specificity phosphatase PhoE